MNPSRQIRWTVGRKLALGFGVTLSFLMAVAAFGLYGMWSINSGLTEIVEVNNKKARSAVAMRIAVNQVSTQTRNIVLLNENPEKMQQEVDKLKTSRDRYDQVEKELGAAIASDAERVLFDRIVKLREKVRPLNSRVVELATKNETVDATSILVNQVAAAQSEWLAALGEMADLQDKLTDQTAEAAEASYAAVRLQMLVLAGVALFVASGFAAVMVRDLLRQLGGEPAYAAEMANQIAAGNLAIRVEVKPGDQRSLLYAMSRMQTALVQVVASIRSGADSIATGSNQIATGNADLSQRTEEQASNLQQTAASMEQLTSTVKNNADTARQAAQLAAHASARAQQGNEAVQQVRGAMQGIEAAATKIGDIIGVIDGIAFQTNILALNAAVEAARAGEEGRGFAVVAGEVRSLAQRSAEAARQVKTLIVDSGEKVAAGGEHVVSASRTMEEIMESVRRVNDLMGDIDAASNEQSQGIDQVSQAVAQLDQVTQQNAALVEESAAAAESLRHQADSLVSSVSVFRLDEALA
ncbi:methyl-accepting chemotaxis protein [Ideonella sp. DXS29W]|uniref:Methyl-accepting chemotaxis protein n=1 Tax=Ideonella lacteola TaxID=2984193 RepID=A0ABU9BMH5_9BURK